MAEYSQRYWIAKLASNVLFLKNQMSEINGTSNFMNVTAMACEDPPMDISPTYIAKIIIGFLTFLFAFPANLITMVPLVKNVRKTPTYAYIINLCLSNLSFACFVNQHDAVWNYTVQWYGGNAVCKISQLMKQFSLTWTSFAVFVIGLDRTLSLLLPLMGRYSPRKRSLFIIIPSLMTAFLICVPASVIYELYDGPVCKVERYRQCVDFTTGYSRELIQSYYIFIVIMQFLVPTLGNLICYALLIYEVTKMVRSEKLSGRRSLPRVPVRGDHTRRKSTSSVSRAKRKLEYMAIYIITAFLFCYGPYYVHGFATKWGQNQTGPGNAFLVIWVQTCLYLAPVIYPIIFCFMLSDVKQFMEDICDSIFKSKSSHHDSSGQHSPSVATRYTQISKLGYSTSISPTLTPELQHRVLMSVQSKAGNMPESKIVNSTPLISG